MFKGICCMASNRVIGINNSLPWPKNVGDLSFFKEKTWGSNVIFGRKTYESLGVKWLPNRAIFVLSNSWDYGWEGAVSDQRYIKSSVARFTKPEELDEKYDFWVAGGAAIYTLFMPKIQEFWVTHLKLPYTGDTILEPFEDRFKNKEIIKENENFIIIRYFN